jgi:glycosyltransferase involved in cell wall biosynthesis
MSINHQSLQTKDGGDKAVALSTIITAFNEGDELRRTINSVLSATRTPSEVIVVDDGSTDDSCAEITARSVRIVRHERRQGVAPSRNHGAKCAKGDVLAFLDAHQRLTSGCLEQCAEIAVARNAIVCPDVCGFEKDSALIHGASFEQSNVNGTFAASYLYERSLERVSRVTALRTPGYVMPRAIYQRVRWPSDLCGWGASEIAISLKAFFLIIPILHLCGPVARHQFKSKFGYEVTTQGVCWNQAVLAKICFSGRWWHEYWLPHVFMNTLTNETLNRLESASIQREHREFQQSKMRADSDFWRLLLRTAEPLLGSHRNSLSYN